MGSFSSENENEKGTSSDVFLVTFLIIFLIILSLMIINRIFYKLEFDNASYHNCTCSKCKARLLYQKQILKGKNINIFLWLYMILYVLILYYVYICCCEISYSAPAVRFDPYSLLNVTEHSSISQIKKAYKKLVLQYHPDKSKESDAKEKFMLISKAYKALSTDEGKKNFLKYGDPDGPNYFRLNISLPNFMLNRNISHIVIGVFIAFIIIILPVSFLKWFSNSKKYNENGMMIIDQSIFYHYLNENTTQTEIPFILGLAFEMNNLISISSSEDKNEIDDYYDKLIHHMPKHSKDKIPLVNQKAICLLYSYFFRSDVTVDNYESDLNKILSLCPFLLKYMIEMCFECSLVAPFANNNVKLFPNTVKTLIYFTQNLFQQGDLSGSGNGNDALLQLPHFNQKIINLHLCFEAVKSLNELINLSKEERAKLFSRDNVFSKEQIEDISIALNNIPQYDIRLDAKIESYQLNNSIVFQGDIDVKNVAKDKLLGLRHSVAFKEAFTEELIVLITLEGKLIDCKIIPISKVSSSFKFAMLTADGGTLNYSIEIYSLNYKGIDRIIPAPLVSSLPKKDMSQYIRQLSQGKIDYFNEMFKQQIPYLEYESNNEKKEDEKEEVKEKEVKKAKVKNKGKPKTD